MVRCSQCGKVFNHEKELGDHLLQYHGLNENPHPYFTRRPRKLVVPVIITPEAVP